MIEVREVEERLASHRVAPAAPGLEARVLARARAAVPSRTSRLDLLWFSRPLRIAAAGLTAAFVVLSVVEERWVEHRLDALFGQPPAPRSEDIRRVSRELGVDTGLRERLLDAARRYE